MIPGEILTASGDIDLNKGRKTLTLNVANTGDRPIQVGSHYHFFETLTDAAWMTLTRMHTCEPSRCR